MIIADLSPSTSRAGGMGVAEAKASSGSEAVRWPFCALDEASYHLDSVSEPWSVHLEVRLSGTVDEDRLRQAVGVSLARYPRARARATTARQQRADYEWEITSAPDVDPLDVVVCSDDDVLQAARTDLQSLAVPLVTSPPLRIRLARHRKGDVVMLNLHHAAGDGIAALRLLRSIARAYAGRSDLVPPTPPEEVEIPAPSGRWAQLRALVGELRHAASRSVHLVPSGGVDRPGYGLYHLVLDTAQTAALSTKTDAGTTVNDLLLTGLHLALDSWNCEHGGAPGRLSVLMPVNLRPKSSWYEVFGNFTFMVPVVTRPEGRSDPTATVQTIRRRTRRIKDEHTPAAVVKLLDVLQHLPLQAKRSIARLAASKYVIPTAILSNLGRLDEGLDFGPELRASEVWFSPPTRMPMGLAVGAVTAEGRLHLVFRYRHPLFGPADVAAFADRYLAALDQIAAAAHVRSTSFGGRSAIQRPGRDRMPIGAGSPLPAHASRASGSRPLAARSANDPAGVSR
ncbi:MAG: condensation domain-containing protein [Actinomycetota bacterium]|nr:condensation domain-containing protein [Actinomycetota bacterium]